MSETSQPVDLLVSVRRDGEGTLGAQLEDQLRTAIRDGALHPGTQLPSTRDLARQLGVSRRIAVDAYGQLASEGYLLLKQGARPRVSEVAASAQAQPAEPIPAPPHIRYDFRPSVPDVTAFPRAAWLRSLREAVTTISDEDLGYGDVAGVVRLREDLAAYLGRVRGVVAEPANVVVTSGYSQGLGLVCQALAQRGARRVAVEDPSDPNQRSIIARASMDAVALAMDDEGLRIDELERTRPDAVVLTPAHHHPTGIAMSPARRAGLVGWLRAHDAIAIEDDYDAEYRYDRAAIGSLQGLAPDQVVYAGTASKTLAPALRLGWLVTPARLRDAIVLEKQLADRGSGRIEQQAFADFLERGELDRHLRRMRLRYRAKRDALVDALHRELDDATVHGIAAGLHVTVRLPTVDEQRLREEAAARHVAFETMGDYRPVEDGEPLTLMLGYGQAAAPAIDAGVQELAAAIRAAA